MPESTKLMTPGEHQADPPPTPATVPVLNLPHTELGGQHPFHLSIHRV